MGKMHRKFAFLGLAFLCTIALVLNNALAASATSQYEHLSSVESEIVSRINGTNIYNYNLELQKIALDHYSFRSSGTVGANETAGWIQEQFESFGLETSAEPFEFTTWSLLAQPVLIINFDGNLSTTDDQVAVGSFQCEHYSWPTPDKGVNASLVTLPLPYDPAAWIAVNTEDKVLLIAGEVQQDKYTYLAFTNKLAAQPPAAIIFAWSSDTPPVFSPCAGKDFWNFGTSEGYVNIPVGWISYGDGQSIRDKMAVENVSAFVSISATIGQGPHYNVVAKLPGTVNPEKMIIISAHYDSSMDAAFCDDGAGTSAVVELARVFSEAAREGIYKPQYTLAFIAFAGEELRSAGSVNYVKQHSSELGNIAALINLDSLGSETMQISETFQDDNGLDLQSVVKSASNDLGVKIKLTAPGGSDQETFRNPVATDDIYLSFWGARSGIRNMTRVKSSIMISSYPLTWINTENDNSTSTATLGRVTVDRLESQTRVAGLSSIRILSTIFSPFLLEIYGSTAAVGVAVAIAAYFERSRLKTLYRGLVRQVRMYIGTKEVVYVIVLTVIFLFASFAFHSRAEETEIVIKGYPTIVTVEYYGTPFEMFGIVGASFDFEGGSFTQSQAGGIIALWGGLLASVALFLLSAFVITLVVTKVRYTHSV